MKKVRNTAPILGVAVSSTPISGVIDSIEDIWQKKASTKPYFIVTAYSEFFLEAERNTSFRQALEAADLVTADGVIALASQEYLSVPSQGWHKDFWEGLRIGFKILRGGYTDRVTGVRLTEQLLEKAGAEKRKVFILGGWNKVAEKIAVRAEERGARVEWDNGPVKVDQATEKEHKQVIQRIAQFSPDLLLVSFGRVQQELWIARHLPDLKARVVIGVGSAFDEITGTGVWKTRTPAWIEKAGLKWLWRVTQDPSHLSRAWNAFPVLAWKLYRIKRSQSRRV